MDLVNMLVNANDLCTSIPEGIKNLVHLVVVAIQVVVPILLIIWGMLDFAKAIIGQKEDDIKAGQKIFMRRLVAAIVVFLVVVIVQLTVNIANEIGGEGNQSSEAWSCASQLINGN